MTLTIRCNCGNQFVIDDDSGPLNGPGDVTTESQNAGTADQYLGFTTPALGEER